MAPVAGEIAQIAPEVGELVGEVPSLSPLDPAAARFRLYDAVSDVLGRLTAETPLVVLLDDLHWMDVASLELATAGGRGGRVPAGNLAAATRRSQPDPADRGPRPPVFGVQRSCLVIRWVSRSSIERDGLASRAAGSTGCVEQRGVSTLPVQLGLASGQRGGVAVVEDLAHAGLLLCGEDRRERVEVAELVSAVGGRVLEGELGVCCESAGGGRLGRVEHKQGAAVSGAAEHGGVGREHAQIGRDISSGSSLEGELEALAHRERHGGSRQRGRQLLRPALVGSPEAQARQGAEGQGVQAVAGIGRFGPPAHRPQRGAAAPVAVAVVDVVVHRLAWCRKSTAAAQGRTSPEALPALDGWFALAPR